MMRFLVTFALTFIQSCALISRGDTKLETESEIPLIVPNCTVDSLGPQRHHICLPEMCFLFEMLSTKLGRWQQSESSCCYCCCFCCRGNRGLVLEKIFRARGGPVNNLEACSSSFMSNRKKISPADSWLSFRKCLIHPSVCQCMAPKYISSIKN